MQISSKGYCVVRRVQQVGWADTLLKSWEDFHLQAQSIFWGGFDKGFPFCTQLQGQDSWICAVWLAHTCISNTWELEASGFMSLIAAWSTPWALDQSGLHRKTPLSKAKRKKGSSLTTDNPVIYCFWDLHGLRGGPHVSWVCTQVNTNMALCIQEMIAEDLDKWNVVCLIPYCFLCHQNLVLYTPWLSILVTAVKGI